MPSSIKYVSVTFLQDYDAGMFVIPTGFTCSVPERMADGMQGVVIKNGPGNESNRLIPSSTSQFKASAGMTASQLAQMIQMVGPTIEANAPWGIGRETLLDAGLYDTPLIALPTINSITGPGNGSAVLKFGKHKTVTQESGILGLSVVEDLLQKRGIHGRGTLRGFTVDGYYDDPAVTAFPVHGYYGPQPYQSDLITKGSGDIHAMEHVTYTKCTGSGVKVVGRDQLAAFRLKCNDNQRFGIELIDVNDSKLVAPGSNGNLLGAAYIEHCATPKFIECDFGNPNNGFIGPFTVWLVDQVRAHFAGGEIQGRIGIFGRNDTNSNRWEQSGNVFDGVNFKIDGNLSNSFTYLGITISAQIFAQDIDGLIIANCRLQYNDNQPPAGDITNTPDYFIQVDSQTDPSYKGSVRFVGMTNLAHRRSRPGAALPPLMGFKKHYCNQPELIEWDFAPGEPVLRPVSLSERNFVDAGAYGGSSGATYNKVDYPLGYLFHTLSSGGTLDDVATAFSVVPAPVAPPTGMKWRSRVWG